MSNSEISDKFFALRPSEEHPNDVILQLLGWFVIDKVSASKVLAPVESNYSCDRESWGQTPFCYLPRVSFEVAAQLGLRTKRWMSDGSYSSCLLYYPDTWASKFLPLGVPVGQACVQRSLSSFLLAGFP